MTLPNERTRAVLHTRDFLMRLMSPYLPDSHKRIPRHVREEARRLLKHYPGVVDIASAGEQLPGVFDSKEAWRVAGEL